MEIEHKTKEGCEVFYLTGNIEIYSTEDLRTEILEAIEKNNYDKVVINLEGVDFIDSSGLGLLMNLQFKLKDIAKFRFCSVKENIKVAIEYTNLISFFQIDDTEEESIKKFGAGA